jgi:NTP pyrophosphatase (non-canonical NTP hydrolase)
MKMNEYQHLAKRTIPNLDVTLVGLNMCLGLCGEAGEVAELTKKSVFHGHSVSLEEYEKELGDVLWYLSGTATILGLNLEDIAAKNIEKLKKRFPDGFRPEDSIRRVDTE